MSDKLSFSLKKFIEVFRKPVTTPTYVLNLIDYRNFASYRIYGLLIFPMIFLSGGRVPWAGRVIKKIYGEPATKNVVFVRYVNHRRFQVFIANPFFPLVNGFRDRGVEKFEASFSRTFRESGAKEIDAKYVLGIHFNSDEETSFLDSNKTLMESFNACEILAIKEHYTMDFLTAPKANEPNPHTYKVNQFFKLPGKELEPELNDKLVELAKSQKQCSIQVYTRSDKRDYMPFRPVPKYYLPS